MNREYAARWIVIGNSGSGKSTLAQRIGAELHLPVFDLDPMHWHADGRKRDEAEAIAAVEPESCPAASGVA